MPESFVTRDRSVAVSWAEEDKVKEHSYPQNDRSNKYPLETCHRSSKNIHVKDSQQVECQQRLSFHSF